MTNPLMLSLEGSGPLTTRLVRALRSAIQGGVLRAGDRLPSTRALASDLGVSRTTAVTAYDQLLAEGYVEGRVGAGTFVARELPDRAFEVPRRRRATARGERPARLSAYARRALAVDSLRPAQVERPTYDLTYGMPSMEDFPQETWLRVLQRCVRDASHAAFEYGPAEGEPELRAAIADYLARARGVQCTSEQVLVVGGSQQALDLTARVLVDVGDRVVLEEPHYQGARHVFTSAGAQLEAIPVDEAGIVTDALPAGRGAAKLAYVTPSHQFPIGVTMSYGRRIALLEWAERTGAFVLEDDYDSEYRYSGRPIESLQGLDRRGVVIYTGTFSKVLFPALRIGYLVLPESLVEPFRRAKWLADRHTATLEQRALAAFLSEGHFERHLRRARTRNASRRRAMLDSLEGEFGAGVRVQGENAGIHLVVWMLGWRRREFERAVERARGAGIGVQSVRPYYLGRAPRQGLLLGFSNLTEPRIEQGVRALARALNGSDASSG